MTEPSSYLFKLADKITRQYTRPPQTRAPMVTGSVAERQSDFYSDIDMTIYCDELPTEETLVQARLCARLRRDRSINRRSDWLRGLRN